VKIVYVASCTATCNNAGSSVFLTQQAAALAAGKQNHFWDYTELFYHEQGDETSNYVNESYLDGLARQIPGLDFNAWKAASADSTLRAAVQADEASGSRQGISATPTLIFEGPKGKAQPSASVPSYAELQQSLQQVS
jgi:protein-disulfide isomerase